MAGKLVLPAHRKDLETPLRLAPWVHVPEDPKLVRPCSVSTRSESACELLTALFLARKAEEMHNCPTADIILSSRD
ncbi:hypothetical protein HRG_008292 [Hirsutella rhossiliensis]|uniref:Uncharacterized protein n=1 Tax=Hirsutella rhossiliensis TaxID=111463 RepID=A0A9P8MVF0_9HYPO|nr:uncharacterized protein HRG_08292 [Hirsutella rhossiliensis]KAH0961139.1 hypothetical protein HRG_08292 [Hirsutella rhossiliensis]